MSDLIQNLTDLATYKHSDLSVALDARDEIERLRWALRDISLRVLNVASCLKHGMDPHGCAAEIQMIVDRAAVQPKGTP
jgi:hypothetical protein